MVANGTRKVMIVIHVRLPFPVYCAASKCAPVFQENIYAPGRLQGCSLHMFMIPEETHEFHSGGFFAGILALGCHCAGRFVVHGVISA